jgi:hypothetical protein
MFPSILIAVHPCCIHDIEPCSRVTLLWVDSHRLGPTVCSNKMKEEWKHVLVHPKVSF